MWRSGHSLIDDYCSQLGSLLDRRYTEKALTGARQRAEAAARLAEDALHQAQAADRAKTNFLANVTHELRTPLNAIIGFSEIIGNAPSTSADHAAYGKYIHEAGTRLLGIVNNVLVLARVEAGKLELDEQVASLNEVLGASIKASQPDTESQAIAIIQENSDDHLVYIDPNKMKQAFAHLLSNAVKFNTKGGAVRVSTKLLPAGELRVSIRDNGSGIPAEDLERVLEPFSQVEDHLTRENEGVGLGLPLARAMIRLHGGELTLTSEVGIGTLVDVNLPANRIRNSSAG
jgi:signal transduction histidine kinase